MVRWGEPRVVGRAGDLWTGGMREAAAATRFAMTAGLASAPEDNGANPDAGALDRGDGLPLGMTTRARFGGDVPGVARPPTVRTALGGVDNSPR